jgi:hypothetical protein
MEGIEVPAALSRAMVKAVQDWPRHEGRVVWICEDLLPSLAVAGLAVVPIGELQRLGADRDSWRFRCRVDAEQVSAVRLSRDLFYRWKATGSSVAQQIATELSASHTNAKEPSPKWWASTINRYTETTEAAQRLLDEIVAAGRS